MRRYVAKYRGITHSTTGKSPAELLFNRKLRGKLPDLSDYNQADQEVRDRDAEKKGKTKIYVDEHRRARPSDVENGDQGLVKQDKVNKFTKPFNPTPYTVVQKTGSKVVVQSPEGVEYSRNTSHVKKFLTEASAETAEESEDAPTNTEATEQDRRQVDTEADPQAVQVAQPSGQKRQRRLPSRLKDFVLG